VAALPGALVLVSDGVYSSGGTTVPDPVIAVTTNRVAVTTPLTIQSLNGPSVTAIRGYQAAGTDNGIRCVYLTNRAVLVGFTLTNGGTRTSSNGEGAGILCASSSAVLSNCVMVGNVAATFGGGACFGTLNNCIIFDNFATNTGGGVYHATLNNCTVVLNSAGAAGGAAGGNAQNSIFYYNSDAGASNYDSSFTPNYCCTTPLPSRGTGNITNDPALVNLPNGNFRLLSTSPCINSGRNIYSPGLSDFDGNPRIVGATVDQGAFEFQNPTSVLSYGWLQQFGLPTDGSADFTDPDGDGMSNWQEWIAGTDPTDPLSNLTLRSLSVAAPRITVTWSSVPGRSYFVGRSSDLALPGPFLTIATNILARTNTTSFIDTNAVGSGPFFYRVAVQAP
jgi:hypothetical protein